MNKDQAFKYYFQGCKDTDPMITERIARIYFELFWKKEAADSINKTIEFLI